MKNQHDDMATVLPELPVIPGVVTGTLSGFTSSGEPLVETSKDGARCRLQARACVALGPGDIGRRVVLVFEPGEPESPIILGLFQPRRSELPAHVEVDGKTVVLTGADMVVLRCGDSSITLNRDGKVVIRGQHVVTHASGVNRIRGGSVQLN